MRHRVRVVAAWSVLSMLVVALIGGAYVGGVHLTHRRNGSAFLASLTETQAANVQSGAQPAALSAPELLLAEGQQACDWLSAKPHALWRSGQRYERQVMLNHYVEEAIARPAPWTGSPDEPAIADAAWTYLCPASVELRRPLPGFRGPSD